MNIADSIALNRVGWDAIQHKDGWWVGNAQGVPCYADNFLARAAMTVIWQREGGRQLNYRIKPFTGGVFVAGDYTPSKSAEKAIRDYEAKASIAVSQETCQECGYMRSDTAPCKCGKYTTTSVK